MNKPGADLDWGMTNDAHDLDQQQDTNTDRNTNAEGPVEFTIIRIYELPNHNTLFGHFLYHTTSVTDYHSY